MSVTRGLGGKQSLITRGLSFSTLKREVLRLASPILKVLRLTSQVNNGKD